MKYILLFIFLFIPSVRASEDALSCSYNINGKTVNFGYYISSDNTPVITSFIVDGESYSYYYNKISFMFQVLLLNSPPFVSYCELKYFLLTL